MKVVCEGAAMAEYRMQNVLLLWAMIWSVLFGVGCGSHSCDVLLATYNGFTNCQNLPKYGATLAWTIDTATNTIDFAFSGA